LLLNRLRVLRIQDWTVSAEAAVQPCVESHKPTIQPCGHGWTRQEAHREK
jgi:hypothetical protein